MIKGFLKILQDRWNSYKYRFVPWVVLNMRRNERTLRQVRLRSQDKLLPDEEVLSSILRLFKALFSRNLIRQREVLRLLPCESQTTYLNSAKRQGTTDKDCDPHKIMLDMLGFSIERRPSSLLSAGTGVFVSMGKVLKGDIVAMYPGTVYEIHDPIFFQSVCNPFVFRCIDGVLIDGNDKGISRIVYRSCTGRDRLGPVWFSDTTWLTAKPHNPMGVDNIANVCYQELDIPVEFPLELWQYLPNVKYSTETQRLRCVVLVALRDIDPGEELFSNYYTLVH